MRHESIPGAGPDPRPDHFERRPAGVVWLSVCAVALLLVLHYTAALRPLGVHDALRRLFYLPVIFAAMAGGMRGGVCVATLAGVGYLPHLRQLAGAGDRVMDSAIELVLLVVVGGLVGRYADESRRARALAAERGRLAALGETGLALMAQTEGPLAAIDGQAEALMALAEPPGAHGGIGFAARVIHEEVGRARHLIGDLAEIARLSGPATERVELPPLLDRVVRDVAGARRDGRKVVLVDPPRSCPAEGNRRAVAFALRTLVFGLLDGLPSPGWLEVRVAGAPGTVPIVEIGLFTVGDALPDLEERLTRVFGAATGEYHFRQVFCLRLLSSFGVKARFQSVSPCHSRILLLFPPAKPAPCAADGAGHGGLRVKSSAWGRSTPNPATSHASPTAGRSAARISEAR